MSLLASPRAHRRALKLGVAAVLAGAIAAAVALGPASSGHRKETFSNRPAQIYTAPKQVRLTATERRAIDAVLGRWVDGAVARRDPLAAYELSTPALRAGASRAQWKRGELPVPPYTPRGRPGWRVDYAYRGDAVVDVVLQPGRGEKHGIIYTAEVKRLQGRWLVDSFVPSATFGGGVVYSHVDMGPQAVVAQPVKGRVGGHWMIVLLGCVASLILLVPLGIFLPGWIRGRRAQSF